MAYSIKTDMGWQEGATLGNLGVNITKLKFINVRKKKMM